MIPKYVTGAGNHGTTKTATRLLQRQVEIAVRGPRHQARAVELPWTVVLNGTGRDIALAMCAEWTSVNTSPKKKRNSK